MLTAAVKEREGPRQGWHPPSDRAVDQDSRGRCVARIPGTGDHVEAGIPAPGVPLAEACAKHAAGRLGQEDREAPLGVKTARNHRFDNGKTRL